MKLHNVKMVYRFDHLFIASGARECVVFKCRLLCLKENEEQNFRLSVLELEQVLCAQAWKPSSQHAGETRGVAGLLLGYWEGPSELPERRSSSSAPRRGSAEPRPRGCSGLGEPRPALPSF